MVNRFRSFFARLHRDEAGQGLVEYVLVVSLLVLTAITSMNTVATALNQALTKVGTTITCAVDSTAAGCTP